MRENQQLPAERSFRICLVAPSCWMLSSDQTIGLGNINWRWKWWFRIWNQNPSLWFRINGLWEWERKIFI